MDEREAQVRHETAIVNAGSSAIILTLIAAFLVGVAVFLFFGGYAGSV